VPIVVYGASYNRSSLIKTFCTIVTMHLLH
jgi:hypothetical protein